MNIRIDSLRIFKEKFFIFVAAMIFCIATLFYVDFSIVPADKAHSFIHYSLKAYLCFAFIVLSCALKYVKEIHYLYLTFAIVLGTVYFIAVPLGRVPDEPTHYCRIYEISEGCFFTPIQPDGTIGSYLPKGFSINSENYRVLLTHFSDTIDDSVRELYSYPTAALYAPICYIPQALGVFIFRIFTKNPLILYYGARLCNYAVGIIITFFSIKMIPYGKSALFAISMMPMLLHQFVSVSADVLTIALAFFVVSLTLYMTQECIKIKGVHLAALALSLIALSLCKIAYILFALLVFLIPSDRFKNVRFGRIFKASVVFFILAVNILWFLYTSRYFITFREGVNVAEQIKFVLKNPFEYLVVLVRTLYNGIFSYIVTMVGGRLGYLDIACNFTGYGIYLFVLFIALFVLPDKQTANVKTKMIMAIISLGTIVLIFSALYAQWTPVASDIVDGVQGRYFISILLPLALFIPKIGRTENGDTSLAQSSGSYSKRYMLYLFIVFCNAIALIDIFKFYIK